MAVFIAGNRAGIFADEAIRLAGQVNATTRHNALATYVYANRAGLLYKDRNGIPNGAIPAGHIIVWGQCAHVALSAAGHQASEFDKNYQGLHSIDNINNRYRDTYVMWALPPTTEELNSARLSTDEWDFNGLSKTQENELLTSV
ncbi:hypothetical protein [Flexibacterium corallicola]|uniref:hypothetical protein n=1 Tax=Flexibacterium corallicola TaxID=3037259 RepID=UPI00286EEFF2|nr:hypothetical protein [Pseudovibrio sp. M1P-2-3]